MYKDHNKWTNLLRERIWERLGNNMTCLQFDVPSADPVNFQGKNHKYTKLGDLATVI